MTVHFAFKFSFEFRIVLPVTPAKISTQVRDTGFVFSDHTQREVALLSLLTARFIFSPPLWDLQAKAITLLRLSSDLDIFLAGSL